MGSPICRPNQNIAQNKHIANKSHLKPTQFSTLLVNEDGEVRPQEGIVRGGHAQECH